MPKQKGFLIGDLECSSFYPDEESLEMVFRGVVVTLRNVCCAHFQAVHMNNRSVVDGFYFLFLSTSELSMYLKLSR
jgi:hypothetical protein